MGKCILCSDIMPPWFINEKNNKCYFCERDMGTSNDNSVLMKDNEMYNKKVVKEEYNLYIKKLIENNKNEIIKKLIK